MNKKRNKERLRKLKDHYDDTISGSVKILKSPRKRKGEVCTDIPTNGNKNEAEFKGSNEKFKLIPRSNRPHKGTSSSKSSSSRLHSPTKVDKKKRKKKEKDDKRRKNKMKKDKSESAKNAQSTKKKTPSLHSATVASVKSSISMWLKYIYDKPKEKIQREKQRIEKKEEEEEKEEELSEEHDWWTRYYASVEV